VTTERPKRLLTQNSELREIGVWNWTLPAWVIELPDGSKFNVCPSAGACASLCYARHGTYLFPNVRAAHLRNLMFVIEDLNGWSEAMCDELARKKFRPSGTPRPFVAPEGESLDPWLTEWTNAGGQAVRVHDAGDYFSDEYTEAWLDIASCYPDVMFYSYTKEVERFRRVVVPDAPENFRWLFSLGGRQDSRIDKDTERHADVFPDEESITAAGYVSQEASDLYAITLATSRVGIPANNIRHFRKRQGGETFGTLQESRHASDLALAPR